MELEEGAGRECDNECQVVVDVSFSELVITSDMLDYEMQPIIHLFDKMNLWEFIERSKKVSHTAVNNLQEVTNFAGVVHSHIPMPACC